MVTICTWPGAAMASGTCARATEIIGTVRRHAMAMPVGAGGFMCKSPLSRRSDVVSLFDGELDRAAETFAAEIKVNGTVHLRGAELEQVHAKPLPARLGDRGPPSLRPMQLDFVSSVYRLGLPLYDELASWRR